MTEPHQHCWHMTGQCLTSYPPQYPEVCCHCGEQRIQPNFFNQDTTKHGKFNPDRSWPYTITQT